MRNSFKKRAKRAAICAIAIALLLSGCSITNSKNNTQDPIQNNNEQLDVNKGATEERIGQLAIVWAEALKTRDGEPRYKMMSESARTKFEQEQIDVGGEDWNYVIGVSSPRVVDYNIEINGSIAVITYTTLTSEPAYYSSQEKVVFKQEGDELVVDDYRTMYDAEPIDDNVLSEE